MAKAKAVMDAQYETIMLLLAIVVKKDLTPEEQNKVDEIMNEQLIRTRQRVSPLRTSQGGNPLKTPGGVEGEGADREPPIIPTKEKAPVRGFAFALLLGSGGSPAHQTPGGFV